MSSDPVSSPRAIEEATAAILKILQSHNKRPAVVYISNRPCSNFDFAPRLYITNSTRSLQDDFGAHSQAAVDRLIAPQYDNVEIESAVEQVFAGRDSASAEKNYKKKYVDALIKK